MWVTRLQPAICRTAKHHIGFLARLVTVAVRWYFGDSHVNVHFYVDIYRHVLHVARGAQVLRLGAI